MKNNQTSVKQIMEYYNMGLYSVECLINTLRSHADESPDLCTLTEITNGLVVIEHNVVYKIELTAKVTSI